MTGVVGSGLMRSGSSCNQEAQAICNSAFEFQSKLLSEILLLISSLQNSGLKSVRQCTRGVQPLHQPTPRVLFDIHLLPNRLHQSMLEADPQQILWSFWPKHEEFLSCITDCTLQNSNCCNMFQLLNTWEFDRLIFSTGPIFAQHVEAHGPRFLQMLRSSYGNVRWRTSLPKGVETEWFKYLQIGSHQGGYYPKLHRPALRNYALRLKWSLLPVRFFCSSIFAWFKRV